MSLISILVTLLIAGFCAWIILQLPFIAQPFKNIIIGIICLFVILYLLQSFGLISGMSLRLR